MGGGQADARPQRDDGMASRAFGHRRETSIVVLGADEKNYESMFRRAPLRPLRLRTFAPHISVYF